MKDIGASIELKEKVSFTMLMEIYTRENGIETKLTVMVCTYIKMEQDMKANGYKIYNMGKGMKFGKMDLYMMEHIMRERSMVLVPINGKISPVIGVNGIIIRLMV